MSWREPWTTAARKCSEVTMATSVILGLVALVAGVFTGAFLMLSMAIRREDRSAGSPRFYAPSSAARSARNLVGLSSKVDDWP
jgi:hypothetical protein